MFIIKFPLNYLYSPLISLLLVFPLTVVAQDTIAVHDERRTLLSGGSSDGFRHNVGITFRPAFVIPSAPFFVDASNKGFSIRHSLSGHMSYSFGFPSGSLGNRVFSDTYQGIGMAYYDFGNRLELGNPFAAYVFQRSRISRLSSRISLDYEWNFGLSAGWKPYDHENNPNNIIIGSKVNAYLNVGLHVNWKLAHNWALISGIDATHFSNGNTEFPNAGLNTVGFKAGFLYDFLTAESDIESQKGDLQVPKFPRHISYDLVVFGSWKRKGVDFFGRQVASPHKYPVVGAYFAPMYNFGYRFRAGFSLDAIYDGSANVYTVDYFTGTEQAFFKPSRDRQVALGASARGEYVMPIFTISVGMGANVLHRGGDLRGTYQAVALKVRTSRSLFLHIGYNLKDFQEPNYLMLGLGYRFNNRTPSLLSN